MQLNPLLKTEAFSRESDYPVYLYTLESKWRDTTFIVQSISHLTF